MASVDDGVSQDPSCMRGFLWNVDHGRSAETVIARLQADGWSGTSVRDVLWTFVKGTHKAVFVPSNGRLQVRVDMMTPHDDRRPVAEAVWRVVTGDGSPTP